MKLSNLALLTTVVLSSGLQAANLDSQTNNAEADTTYVRDADVNYGDPTASYRGVGVQATDDAVTLSGVFGTGEHIASVDGTFAKGDNFSYRARYFNVDQVNGFGVSFDVLGSKGKDSESLAGLVGVVQKFEVTPQFLVVPMLSAGYGRMSVDVDDKFTVSETSFIAQPGIYFMYGFEAGHWLYANPKATYVKEMKEWTNELELGGGYMIRDDMSMGFKYEVSRFQGNTDQKAWANIYYYF